MINFKWTINNDILTVECDNDIKSIELLAISSISFTDNKLNITTQNDVFSFPLTDNFDNCVNLVNSIYEILATKNKK